MRPTLPPAALALALLATMILGPPRPADAAKWKPSHRWSSLHTEHFVITYHEGLEDLAVEMSFVAEEVHAVLSPYLKWEPRERTQILLVDPTDGANGYATFLPVNQVVLFVTQPSSRSSLDNYEDWLWAIFVHEYTHTLQIDMVGGLPQAVRFVLGRLIVPNAVMPRWLTEGYATYMETIWTTGGRGRSTYTDMLVRSAALEDKLPPIDIAEGFGSRWPGGQMRYLYGARFHFYAAEQAKDHQRDGAWVDFHRRHGRGVIPFLLPAKESFGKTFSRMWKDWKLQMAKDALATADRISEEGRGLTATRRLPSRAGYAYRPRYSPDGEGVLYVHSAPSEPSSVRLLSRDGRDREIREGSLGGLEYGASGRYLYGVAAGFTDIYSSYLDLYRIDPDDGERTRLTFAARLSSPSPHPNGHSFAAVQTANGRSQIVLVELSERQLQLDAEDAAQDVITRPLRDALDRAKQARDQPQIAALKKRLRVLRRQRRPLLRARERERRPYERRERSKGEINPYRATVRPLTDARDFSQFDSLAWDPSGSRLAFSAWKPGGFRDIHILYPETGEIRAISWDRAGDVEPTWSPDGSHLIWASDRDGVWNLYAWRARDGAVFRVTRLLGGARSPDISPDGRRIVFQGYGPEGWHLEELPFDPAALEPAPLSARSLPGPRWGPSAQALSPLDPLEGVPGPAFRHGSGPIKAVARDQAHAGFGLLPQGGEAPERAPTDVAAFAADNDLKYNRYNPLPTLLPPRYISPFGYLTDTGALGGLGIGGSDQLDQHRWGASISYRTDSRYIGWGLSYLLNAFHPRIGVSFSTLTLNYGKMWLRTPEPKQPGGTSFAGAYRGDQIYFEKWDRLSLGAYLPIGRRGGLSLRYKLEFRSPLRDLPDDIDPRLLPARGSFSGIVLGWSWGKFTRYQTSISPEDSELFSVSLDIESSYLGAYRVLEDGSRAQLHRGILTIEGRKYVRLPWAKNHVLAMRAALGATIGSAIPQKTFRIGGSYGDSPFVSLPDRYYGLRGYPTSFQRGDHLYLASLEYRLPLLLLERGLFTAPAFLRSISLTLFGELGRVFDNSDLVETRGQPAGVGAFLLETQPAVGVELVGDAILFWEGLFQARVGYAFGFGKGAYPSGQFYAQLGTSF